jgi:hypothetical protein
MHTKLLTGTFGIMLLLSPLTFAQDQKPAPAEPSHAASAKSDDMSRAIAWEHAKDRAAARQAAIEARRSRNDQNADRKIEDRTVEKDTGRKVKDTKVPGATRDKDK